LRDVVCIGAGGLGCPSLWELARVGRADVRLVIVDDDVVDLSNLQRQILHREADVGRPKVESARDALARRFPKVQVSVRRERAAAANVRAIVRGAAVVLDGTDSFDAKFLINDACVAEGVPLVHGAVVGFSGQLMSVAGGSACFRCLFEAPPPEGSVASCEQAGIIGAVAGVIGARMAEEALAILDGTPRLAGALDVWDARSLERRTVRIKPRAGCEAHMREVA
jgi:adenylyltransferase/sulfurtransferase